MIIIFGKGNKTFFFIILDFIVRGTYCEVERGSILKDGAVVTSVAQKGLYLYLMIHSIALSLFN